MGGLFDGKIAVVTGVSNDGQINRVSHGSSLTTVLA